MRVPCPLCGTRDRREFTWGGDAVALDRPKCGPTGGWSPAWDDYIHNRANPAGATRDLWYHDACGTWIVVDRDTVTHAVHGAGPAADASRDRTA